MYNGKSILITGGTGSFGKRFAAHLLDSYKPKKVIIFSRSEEKQAAFRKENPDSRLRFFLGDVRDLPRLKRAFEGVDIVVHAAALKHVPLLEYNPYEAVKTNIIGSQNVVEAAIDCGVEKALFISTDKAAQPINLYGATKLCAEKLFVDGNAYAGGRKTKLACVRYGNVLGSSGSVVEMLIKSGETLKKAPLTHPSMTRFWITFPQSFELVTFALKSMKGGEIFIPKLPSMKVKDMFDVLAPNAKQEIIGIRPGEKVHEVLLPEDEARNAFDLGKYFVVLPAFQYGDEDLRVIYAKKGKRLQEGFRYSSADNTEWFTKKDLLGAVKSLKL